MRYRVKLAWYTAHNGIVTYTNSNGERRFVKRYASQYDAETHAMKENEKLNPM